MRGMMRVARAFGGSAAKSTHYEVIGVSKEASTAEIKTKYKQLVKKYHPDVYKGGDASIFKNVQEAYKVLINPKKRLDYDESLRGAAGPESGSTASQSDWNDMQADYKQNTSSKDFYKDFNKVEVNPQDLDKEYVKFFSQKVKTDFEKVNVREDISLQNMTEKDWKKHEFAEKRNATNKVEKYMMNQGVGYAKTLEETIEVLNQNTPEKQKTRREAMAQGYAKLKGFGKIMVLASTIGFLGILVLGFEVRKAKVKQTQEMLRKGQEIELENKMIIIKDRMVFE